MERRLEEAKQQGIKLERDFYDGKAVGVFDLSKFGYSNADLSALKAVFDLLQVWIILRLIGYVARRGLPHVSKDVNTGILGNLVCSVTIWIMQLLTQKGEAVVGHYSVCGQLVQTV